MISDKICLGIDIGGSFTKAGAVQNGKILHKIKIPTQTGKAGFFTTAYEAIDELLGKYPAAAAIGIGVAGMVLAEKGTILSAVNLGLEKVEVAKEVKARYNKPVAIGNDVACFALGAQHQTGLDNLVYLAIGTGINAGVINRGKLLSGHQGASIEFGHTAIAGFKKPSADCKCGLQACVECFISGKTLTGGVTQEFLFNLGTVLANICNLYRPQTIFIGGGHATIIAEHIKKINQDLKAKNYGYKNAPPVNVEISNISTDGGILGAALLADATIQNI